MIYDSVLLVAKALHEADRSQMVNVKFVNCVGVDSWSHGQSLVNYMKLVSGNKMIFFFKFRWKRVNRSVVAD